MNESILTSIKKMLGITEDYDAFDVDIIIHINSVFSILYQIGLGPKEPFSIVDASSTWNNFIDNDTNLEMIKSYMYKKVKLLFDPPTSSSLLESLNHNITELEWRLFINGDLKRIEEEVNNE